MRTFCASTTTCVEAGPVETVSGASWVKVVVLTNRPLSVSESVVPPAGGGSSCTLKGITTGGCATPETVQVNVTDSGAPAIAVILPLSSLPLVLFTVAEIGRASCREQVCQSS